MTAQSAAAVASPFSAAALAISEVAIAAPLITGMPTSTVSNPMIGDTRSITRQDASIQSAAINTVLHSSISCFTFRVVPMLNSTIAIASFDNAVRPPWSMMSAGISFVRKPTRNRSMTTIIPDSFPFVILPTMSPSANTIRTIMKLENIALFVKISAISFSPLLFLI